MILSDLIDSFMLEIKVVRNVILNKIVFHDQPSRMYRSPPRVAKNVQILKKRKQEPLAAPPDIMGI